MPSTTPWTLSPLPALGAVALLALTGCQGGEDDAPDDGASTSSSAAPSESSDGAGQEGDGDADGTAGGSSSAPDGSEESDDAEGSGNGATTFTSAEGTYSWEVPAGLDLGENTAEEYPGWPDGESTQRYPITGSSGLVYGDIIINTATDADGPRAMHREVLDSQRLPDAAQGDTEAWVQSLLYSNCLTTTQTVPEGGGESGEPSGPEDCEYRVTLTLASVEPGQSPEDSDVWVYFHNTPEEQAGNVMMNATLPATPEGGDPTWLSREEAEQLTGTPEYQELWELFTSFTLHEDAVEGPEESADSAESEGSEADAGGGESSSDEESQGADAEG